LKPAAALVFNFLLDLLLEAPEGEFKHKTALILDEFTNFGLIPGIAKKMTIVRHRKMPVVLGIQDYVQLKSVYGEDDATLLFTQPATRVIFRTPDLSTARKVSESLGQETVVERKLTTTCQVSEREFGRALMTPAEIMAMEPEKSIVFTPATDPLKIERYSWKDYVEQVGYAPPVRQEVKVDPNLVLLLEDQEKPPKWEQELEEGDGPGGAGLESQQEKGSQEQESKAEEQAVKSDEAKETRKPESEEDESLPI
jgi:type IV secretory pathway TraG/TraD family ATPase VirD4